MWQLIETPEGDEIAKWLLSSSRTLKVADDLRDDAQNEESILETCLNSLLDEIRSRGYRTMSPGRIDVEEITLEVAEDDDSDQEDEEENTFCPCPDECQNPGGPCSIDGRCNQGCRLAE